jgi:hypothetical protein
MKRIVAIAGVLLMALGIFSCKNQSWSFPDFDYTTTYFPNQYPVRTLVFGDYVYDNSGDNKLQFLISADMGGVYNNKKDISVDFVVDTTLTQNLFTSSNTPIKAMPASWYTLSSDKIIIPNGKFSGGVTAQLDQKFVQDTNSIGAYWVIPLKITASTTDSVLQGKSGMSNPDPRIAGNWAIAPKNFTLFGVKYVNEWHGKYLLRGTDLISKADGTPLDTIRYHAQFLEGNQIISLLTSRRNQIKYGSSVRFRQGTAGNFEMAINFQPNDITSGTIVNTTRYPNSVVSGTVKMVLAKDSPESWGNQSRSTIYLDYQILNVPTAGAYAGQTIKHVVKDTLVFRDKAVKYEEFVPKVVLP